MTGDTLFGDATEVTAGATIIDTETDTRLSVRDIHLEGGNPRDGHVVAVDGAGDVRLIDWPTDFNGRYVEA